MRICLAPILIVVAMGLLLVVGSFHQELAEKSDWLAMLAVVFNLAGIGAAWGVRRHLVGRASLLGALVLMSAVAWEFFRR
ncbi:MAG TPA: hypothetical protein VJS65_11205 [Verrucomicrobiae bacterium]|nr:hypothetical protein [Verrucomicrobiae bacterium]